MNRNQRKYGYKRPKSGEAKTKNGKVEVAAPRARLATHSRCCHVSPDQNSFAQLTNSHLTDSTGQPQSPVRAVTRKAPIPDQTKEPATPKHPELITIAGPKRPTLYDMPAKTRRPYQRTLRGRKPQRDIDPQLSSQPVLSTTDPQSNPDFISSDENRSTLTGLSPAQIQELRKILFPFRYKIDKASQYIAQLEYKSSCEETMQWTSDNADEIDKMIVRGIDEETLTQYHNLPRNLRISEVPRIKLMAEKFKKYKKEHVELRRLEEKVVCVEYDVFDKEVDPATPVQRMRAFFSIKPAAGEEGKEMTELPPTIKSKFNISAADLQKLNQKEIEILDGKILENQPYLDDLRKLLRRRENAQNNKSTLNLQALYEMGKRDLLDFDTNFEPNIMPKEELHAMQNIILKNCKSSVHGIRRKTLKNMPKAFDTAHNTVSRSLVTELLRESNKTFADF